MSTDGARVGPPPLLYGAPVTDSSGAVWEIGSDGRVYCNRQRTNGSALELLWSGGFVWARSGKSVQLDVWFKVVSSPPAVVWQKFTTADPSGAPPPLPQQFPLSAAQKTSLASKMTAINAEISLLGT